MNVAPSGAIRGGAHWTSRTSTIGCTSRGGLFECFSMIAYVKIEFILILVLVGKIRSYKMTIGRLIVISHE